MACVPQSVHWDLNLPFLEISPIILELAHFFFSLKMTTMHHLPPQLPFLPPFSMSSNTTTTTTATRNPSAKKPIEYYFVDMASPDRFSKLKVSQACDFCRRRKSK